MKIYARIKSETLTRHIVQRNMTVSQFADHCGIDRGHMSQLLRGLRHPSGPLRQRLMKGTCTARRKGLDFDDLFEVVEEPKS